MVLFLAARFFLGFFQGFLAFSSLLKGCLFFFLGSCDLRGFLLLFVFLFYVFLWFCRVGGWQMWGECGGMGRFRCEGLAVVVDESGDTLEI